MLFFEVNLLLMFFIFNHITDPLLYIVLMCLLVRFKRDHSASDGMSCLCGCLCSTVWGLYQDGWPWCCLLVAFSPNYKFGGKIKQDGCHPTSCVNKHESPPCCHIKSSLPFYLFLGGIYNLQNLFYILQYLTRMFSFPHFSLTLKTDLRVFYCAK